MKDKLKGNNYINWGITLFCTISACILLYFICLRIDTIWKMIIKLLSILAPIILGILFAYLLNPFVKFLENKCFKKITNNKKHKLARALSIFTTYFIVIIVLFLFVKFVVPSLFESIQVMISNIPIYINNIYEYLKDLFKQSPELSLPLDQINQNITSSLTNVVVPSMDTIMTNLTAGISSFIGGLIDVIIGLIISVYLLYDKESFIKGTKNFFQAFMPEKVYDTVMTTLGFADKIFGGFMIAKIIDSILIGILSFIIFSIFQIPYALIISVIVGVTNVIPYFGPFIGAVPCAMLLLLISPKKAITFLILIFLIQQFDGNILGPKLIGNKTGIKSFWVLFSILVFGGLFGFAGMIFGVPVFAVIYSVISDAINKKLDKKKSK